MIRHLSFLLMKHLQYRQMVFIPTPVAGQLTIYNQTFHWNEIVNLPKSKLYIYIVLKKSILHNLRN